ncbi:MULTISPECIES: glycosyltransferase family A protein [unclassified Cryobacterium]|uniref:glycosyltransferase family A protein n=1 Tax=unclassified Cryobacterium TaxID=2649013 RepID=UPI00106B2026|nr:MULTISPECIES: glycosyltransferase family A protein [unclassified Cryobacterium]TFC00103.1 glycosyltransferase family 2 protein [Cryobacterium sp. MDB2-A-1]TFC09375.1 glycosyltransferase family 2 protein [Cryobacterium sp. MDB2-A-2]TFC22065.1 glycosyltransferase family 2 protein [Cryobacterium sp. MDB2-10]
MTCVSVVIPCYNDAVFLEAVLAALGDQTRPADEIIVVDNASTDASARVARAAGAVLVVEPVQGIWPAAAAGYDAASGDLIARLDADSVPPPDWIERVERILTLEPLVDVVTGPGDFYDCPRLVAALGRFVYLGGYVRLIGLWLAQPPIFGSNFVMRRTVWAEVRTLVHRERNDVHDDLDLSLHLPPSVSVRFDATLRVGISARPFDTWRGVARRLDWAYRTLALHWPEGSPWRLRLARRAWARRIRA